MNYTGERFCIPYPASDAERKKWNKNYSVNAYYGGKPWQLRKRDADFWHLLTVSNMNSQDVRRIPFKRPAIITFHWNDRLDIDNHAIIAKMIVDAMKGRVIEDDTRRWVKGVCHYFWDEDYIGIEVKEIN